MAWWVYLIIAVAVLLVLVIALVMLRPLRIFISYLRKNKDDHLTMVINQSPYAFRLRLLRSSKGNHRVSLTVKLGWWEFRVPVLRRKIEDRIALVLKLKWGEYSPPVILGPPRKIYFSKVPLMFKWVRPFLKKMSWRRFELDMSFGFADPAVTGITAGGCWLIGGGMLGLLNRYLSFKTVPKMNIDPRFDGSPLELRWEGEISMSLFRWLQLLLVTRKIGGVLVGESSH